MPGRKKARWQRAFSLILFQRFGWAAVPECMQETALVPG
jgi:hypothetical protein